MPLCEIFLKEKTVICIRLQYINETCKSTDNNSLCDLQNSCAAKSVALLDSPALSTDDCQALDAIISLWPEFPPDVKISVLLAIESARAVRGKREEGRGKRYVWFGARLFAIKGAPS